MIGMSVKKKKILAEVAEGSDGAILAQHAANKQSFNSIAQLLSIITFCSIEKITVICR